MIVVKRFRWEDYLKNTVEKSMKEQVLLTGELTWRIQTKTPPMCLLAPVINTAPLITRPYSISDTRWP